MVAPSSIPHPRGRAIKTDRLDAGYLAQFYANGLLTIVQPPEAEQEQDRDLLRSRQHLLKHSLFQYEMSLTGGRVSTMK